MFGLQPQELAAFLSMLPLLVVLLIIFLVGAFSRRSSGGFRISGPTLVLKKYKVDESSQDGVLVDIAGRPSGILGWFLTAVGFYGESSFKVAGKQISFEISSRFGYLNQVVPLTNVSSTHCGYTKPTGLLILGVVFSVSGIGAALINEPFSGPAAVVSLIISGLFFLGYFLSKKIVLSLQSNGGLVMGLVFKRSVIENIPVDINKALQTIKLINEKVIESSTREA